MSDYKNLILTGGSGFLGGHICQQLGHLFDKIRIIDIAPIKQFDVENQMYPNNVEYCNCDVRYYPGLFKLFNLPNSIVIHAAAGLPLYSEQDIYSTNIEGTRNVLWVASQRNINKVVFISSTAVYDIGISSPNESDELKGIGPYGKSKIVAEKICGQFRERGMCVPILRPKTFIGPGRCGILSMLFDRILDNKIVPILGNGKNIYQLLDVRELVSVIDLVINENTKKVNDTFNVANKTLYTVNDILDYYRKLTNDIIRVLHIPKQPTVALLDIAWKLKLTNVYPWIFKTVTKHSMVDTSKIVNSLGWKSVKLFETTLADTFFWYKMNRDKIEKGVGHKNGW